MKVLLWAPSANDEVKDVAGILRSHGLEVKTIKGAFSKAHEHLRESWNSLDFVIGVAPLPLCVRWVSGLLKSKYEDPSVLCVRPDGGYVLCLCGEHFRGGKCLASLLAETLQMKYIPTSKLDLMGITPLDELCFRLRLSPSSLRLLNDYVKRQARGFKVAIKASPRMLECMKQVASKGYFFKEYSSERGVNAVICQVNGLKPLALKPRKVVLGMGLCSVADKHDVSSTVERALSVLKMPLRRLDALYVPDFRKGHPALSDLESLVPLKCLKIQGLSRRSKMRSLCEELAIKPLKHGRLLVKKIKGKHSTAALAEGIVHDRTG